MPVSIFDLPYDKNGAPLGRWRVRHRGGLTTNLARCRFVDGVTPEPVEGIKMRHLAAAMGQDLSAEPWDAEAAREIREQVHDSWLDTAGLLSGGTPEAPMANEEPPPEPDLELAPAADPEPETELEVDLKPEDGEESEEPIVDELDAMDLEQLRELAAGILTKVDGRWSENRLRQEIREALAEAE